jgi:hypothetical protein
MASPDPTGDPPHERDAERRRIEQRIVALIEAKSS